MCGSCFGGGNKPTVDDDNIRSQGKRGGEQKIITSYPEPKPYCGSPPEASKGGSASQPKASKGESKTKNDREDEEDHGKSTNIGKPKGGHEENMSIGVGAGAASSNSSVSKDETQQVPSASSASSTSSRHAPSPMNANKEKNPQAPLPSASPPQLPCSFTGKPEEETQQLPLASPTLPTQISPQGATSPMRAKEKIQQLPLAPQGSASPMRAKEKTQQLPLASLTLPTELSSQGMASPMRAKEKTQQLPLASPALPTQISPQGATTPMRAKEKTQQLPLASPTLPTQISSQGAASPMRAKEKTHQLANSTITPTTQISSTAGAASPMRAKEKTQPSIAPATLPTHTTSPSAASPSKSKEQATQPHEPTLASLAKPSSVISASRDVYNKPSTTRSKENHTRLPASESTSLESDHHSLIKSNVSIAKSSSKGNTQVEETRGPETFRSDRNYDDANKRGARVDGRSSSTWDSEKSNGKPDANISAQIKRPSEVSDAPWRSSVKGEHK